jgi:hypothetical protein
MPSDCHDVGPVRNPTTATRLRVCRLNEADQQGVDDMWWFWLVIGCLVLLVAVGSIIDLYDKDGLSPGVFVTLLVVLIMVIVLVTQPREFAQPMEAWFHAMALFLKSLTAA